jgi:site-specific DNA-methyltransferase (adenine-specific)
MEYKNLNKALELPFLDLYHADCMELMKQTPDNYFDLAIVDPPYGIGRDGGETGKNWKLYIKKGWDSKKPTKEYFDELFRISKNQSVWGANYFTKFFELGKGIICWFKHQNGNFSQWEMAYTSIGNAKHFDRSYQQDQYNKIHPTQKPIELYRWLLHTYANKGDKIFDSHLGSGSIAVACDDLGFDLTACEIDSDYFRKANKRLDVYRRQQTLF